MKAMALRRSKERASNIPDLVVRLHRYRYELYNPPVETVEDLYVTRSTQPEDLSDKDLDRLDGLPRGKVGGQIQRARITDYKTLAENKTVESPAENKKAVVGLTDKQL